MRLRSPAHQLAAAGAAAAMLLTLTACGGSSTDTAAESPEEASSETSTAATDSAQHLVVGTSGDFPPLSSLDAATSQIVGFENDMMTAITESLGWTFEWSQMSFDGLLPALQSGRIDTIVSGMYHTEARAEQADFIDYMQVPQAIMTRTEDAAAVTGPMDLCGQTIAHLVASPPQFEQLETWSAECVEAGLEPITPSGFQSVAQAVQGVATGRAFGEIEGDIITLYIAKTEANDALGVAFNVEGGNHVVGMATAQDAEFAPELSAAVEEWVASDAYCETAQKWDFTPSNVLRNC